MIKTQLQALQVLLISVLVLLYDLYTDLALSNFKLIRCKKYFVAADFPLF